MYESISYSYGTYIVAFIDYLMNWEFIACIVLTDIYGKWDL